MKYYLIVGEASGDLHASHLMKSLKKYDEEAEFRFFGGDLMAAEGGEMVRNYKDLAYMGFIPVLLHLPTIMQNMSFCKQDIVKWRPDALILVDYPGFNLSIAKYVHANTVIPVYYYISPKIWAWKEYRIKNIRRDVDELFSILPFEVPFFEQKHHYPIHYVGNPTADEVREYQKNHQKTKSNSPYTAQGSPAASALQKPVIALLAGSRKQEIKDNLPAMLQAASSFKDYELIVAGAPGIEDTYYDAFVKGYNVKIIHNKTYELLSCATAALVTSGTATLETALFNVPQVVCYKTPIPHIIRFAYNHVIKCKHISLVNLIADKEIVKELLADLFSVKNIRNELKQILPGEHNREIMLQGYEEVRRRLGNAVAPDNAAKLMIKFLSEGRKE